MVKKNNKALDISKFDKNMEIKKADENGLVWRLPYEKPFKLAGFYWFDQDKVYRRFPVKPPFPLPEGVEVTLAAGKFSPSTRTREKQVRQLSVLFLLSLLQS